MSDAAYFQEHYRKNRERKKAQMKAYFAKPEVKARRKAYLATRREKDKAWNKSYKLKLNYGLTLAQRDAMLTSQGNVCMICDSPDPRGNGWCVDHCHKTRAIRSILCSPCNMLIGLAKESALILNRAAAYCEGADVIRDHYNS